MNLSLTLSLAWDAGQRADTILRDMLATVELDKYGRTSRGTPCWILQGTIADRDVARFTAKLQKRAVALGSAILHLELYCDDI